MIRDFAHEEFTVELVRELAHYRVVPAADIVLGWDGFKNRSRIRSEDLNEIFEYVWLESSDDLANFDDTTSWMMQITHCGEVRITLLSPVS